MVKPVFSVTADTSKMQARMKAELKDDLPFVIAKSMTLAMKDAQGNIGKNILRKYSRPTPWTQKSTFVQPATKRKLEAAVFFKDRVARGVPAGRFLKPTVRGISRKHKGFEKALIAAGVMKSNEFAMPAKGVKLNQYGNMSNATIKRISTKLDEKGGGGHKIRLFSPPDQSHLPRGVYEARGKWKRRKLKPILIFVTDTPDYKIRLPFKRIANQTYNARFPILFKRNAHLVLSRRNR